MIRADYSGLNWTKLGWTVPMTHAKCGGQIMFSPKYKALFCASCGKWIYLGKPDKPGKSKKRKLSPADSGLMDTALDALHTIK